LEINVDDKNRLVSIWLTKAEKTDENTRNSLKPLYEKYHAEKYKVGVFLSGNGDLIDKTSSLLLHNRYKEVKKRENVR